MCDAPGAHASFLPVLSRCNLALRFKSTIILIVVVNIMSISTAHIELCSKLLTEHKNTLHTDRCSGRHWVSVPGGLPSLGGSSYLTTSSMNRQALLKALPSPAVGNVIVRSFENSFRLGARQSKKKGSSNVRCAGTTFIGSWRLFHGTLTSLPSANEVAER